MSSSEQDPAHAITVRLQETGGPVGGPFGRTPGRRRGRGTVVVAVVACGVLAAGAAFAAGGDGDDPTLGETADLAVAAPVEAAREVPTTIVVSVTAPPTTAAPVPETTAAPQALSVAAEMQPAPTTTAAPKPKVVVPETTAKPAPVETVKKEKAPVVAFTATQAFGSCGEAVPYDEFSGTANPGGWVKVLSSYGEAYGTVDEKGNWALRVEFPKAPVGKAFPVKVKTEQGYKEFSFIRTA